MEEIIKNIQSDKPPVLLLVLITIHRLCISIWKTS